MSQPKFAEFIGVSAPTIASIEGGRLVPSVELAERIAVATGVDPQSIREDQTPHYLNDYQPYSAESWKDWKNQSKTSNLGQDVSREEDKDQADKACKALAFLVAAAGNRNRLGAVLHSFQQWFESTRESYGLQAEWDKVCKEKQMDDLFRRHLLFYTSPQGVIRKVGFKHTYALRKRKPTPGFGLDRTAAAIERQLIAQKQKECAEVAQPVTLTPPSATRQPEQSPTSARRRKTIQ
jgi:DNA-binding XRE family transcriptional regulator